MRIGAELSVTRKEPVLLTTDVLTRRRELREVSLPSSGKKRSDYVARRPETEEEKKMKTDAKEQLKLLEERSKKPNDAGDIKLALNKLTPENYSKVFGES
jgi:hypothetical protein